MGFSPPNMPFVRVWIHLVWSTKNRFPYLTDKIRSDIFNHIRINAKSKQILLDRIGGWVDHVHVLISLGSHQTISKTAQLMKGESSHWINSNNLTTEKFEWQYEYFAVSFDESKIDIIRNYIDNQEEHHRYKSIIDEYNELVNDKSGQTTKHS